MMTFSYMNVPFAIDFARASTAVERKVLEFIGEYFRPPAIRDEAPVFVLRAHSEKSRMETEVLAYGRRTLIHNSKKPSYHEPGLRLDSGLLSFVYNSATRGLYKINRLNDEVTIHNPDAVAIARDICRLARDFVKVAVETLQGGMLLHCAAVAQPDGEVVLLIGNKGSGKSTVMLNLIFCHDYYEVSRDRTFVTLDALSGDLHAHGFPNYYNLTARTIKSLAPISHLLTRKVDGLSESELDSVEEKWPFDSDDLGIQRRLRAGRVVRVVYLEPAGEVMDALASSCFTPHDPNYADWHDWVPQGHKATEWRKVVEVVRRRGESLYWKTDMERAVSQFAAGSVLKRIRGRAVATESGAG